MQRQLINSLKFIKTLRPDLGLTIKLKNIVGGSKCTEKFLSFFNFYAR